MTSYKRGEAILVPFPFSDQSASQSRPALVVSIEKYNRSGPDLIIAAITSQIVVSLGLGDYLIKDWKEAGLLKPSVVKAMLATIEKGLIRRRLGKLNNIDLEAFSSDLKTVLGFGS